MQAWHIYAINERNVAIIINIKAIFSADCYLPGLCATDADALAFAVRMHLGDKKSFDLIQWQKD